MPRSCSAARQCHRGGRRRFHRHTAPPGDAPWRCRLVPSSRTVSEHGRVLTRPSTSAAPDQRCAMCPRRPSCPGADRPESNAAHTVASPLPAGAGPAPGAGFVAGDGVRPFAGPTTSEHGDWTRRRPSSGHPHRPPGSVHASGSAMASRARRLGRLARRRPGHHYRRPVPSPGLALPGRFRAGGAGLGQPLPTGRGWRPRRCGPGHARYQPAQPAADTPPGRRLHGRTEAQALGDADVC